MKSNFFSDFVPKSWICLRKKYSFSFFKSDLIAGTTVGIVALPLAMAFAIGAGLSPEKGLYTAIIAGFLISLLGGSRYQIGGPTGAFVVIIYDIVGRVGYEGLVCVTLLAGVILLIGAFSKVGSWIKFIPYPLITGFTTGIAVIIFSSQVKDFLGLQMAVVPAEFMEKWGAIFKALPTLDHRTAILGGGTLLLMMFFRRFCPKIPWGIGAVVVATAVCIFWDLPVETLKSRFGELPRSLPYPQLPQLGLLFSHFTEYLPDALVVAFLAGIESLLSAVVADGMTGGRHKANCELMAQGIGNIGSILFGGIPATGAIARTATNVKTGAKTPLAGMIHAATLFVILIACGPLVSQIPLAALSAVLMMVAWNMSEMGHFRHLFKAPKGDVVILLTTFFLTVFVDLTIAVAVGMSLAAFLFMKRMGDVSGVFRLEQEGVSKTPKIPKGIEVYEIKGPLFFGVASSLKMILANVETLPKVFIFRMGDLQLIDASGMHALREFHAGCVRDGSFLFLAEIHPRFLKKLKSFGVIDLIGKEAIFPHLKEALEQAERLL